MAIIKKNVKIMERLIKWIENSDEKLRKAILIVTRNVKEDSSYSHVNEILLHNIIVNENSKSFLTKEVDKENQDHIDIRPDEDALPGIPSR